MSYSCSVGTTGKGGSVAAAAYRSAELLYDERTGMAWDYRRKRGVVASFIAAPEGCDWARHRNSLWNAAEAAERRRRATVAREWRLALPAELSAVHREALARAFAVELVARYGVAADVAIHLPSATGDQRNHHAHILTTTRVVAAEGLGAKTRVLDDRRTGPAEITAMRAVWAGLVNEALERAGSAERVDHRSLKAQRAEALAAGDLVRAAALDRAPTRHRGPKREHAAELAEVRAAQLAAEAAERARGRRPPCGPSGSGRRPRGWRRLGGSVRGRRSGPPNGPRPRRRRGRRRRGRGRRARRTGWPTRGGPSGSRPTRWRPGSR